MTSRNEEKLQHSNALNVYNSGVGHKHHRHHDSSSVYQTDDYKNFDKPVQQVLLKNEHRHDYKIDEDAASDVQIQSISGLLRNERHHSRKAKIHDPKLYSDAVINMNQLCGNCHLPKLSELGENSKSVLDNTALTKSKINSKSVNASSTSKYVQTSKTKLKPKRLKQGEEIKRHHSKSTISRKVVSKSKKEIYIITGGDTPFKFTSVSQEHLHSKHKRDKKGSLPIESKVERIASTSNTKPTDDHTSRDLVCPIGRPHTSLELLKQNGTSAIEERNRREDVPVNNGETKDFENHQENNQTIGIDTSRHAFGKYKERKAINQHELESKKRDKYDYPKVISTKLRHRQKQSDATLSDKTRSGEERLQRRHKHRHKHAKNAEDNNFCLPIANICIENDEKILSSKDISSLTKHAIQNSFRKQRIRPNQDPNMSSDELELCRKRILDNIEKAYSKHKHILPKEAVDALDRNIKQWRTMSMEITKKSSDQMSNVLDLEEVLKKNKKGKMCHKDASVKHPSEKTTTASECTLPSGLKKGFKPKNDLILLNAIVTGVNGLDCDKETVHVNKIPKFVRLEEIACEPNNLANKRVLSKINVIQECESEPKERITNCMRGAIPKTIHPQVPQMAFGEDVRKEVSFSQLNVQPAISLYYGNDQQFNYIDGLLPSLLKERRIIKPKKKKICIEKDLLNIFTRKEAEREQNVSKVILDPTTKFTSNDSVFNVEGVQPPKNQNPRISTAYIARKSLFPDLKKLELVVLPVLQISSHCNGSKSLNDEIISPSTAKLLKNSRTQTRKKENHRMHKSSKSSASSSESTVQLINLLDSTVKTHPVSEKRKQRSELKKLYMSDREAIAALKYLPPQHKEFDENIKGDVYHKNKLQKIILSTIEIKSEIPTPLEKIKSNFICNKHLEKSVEEHTSKIFNGYGPKARTVIASQETEFLCKSSQDSKMCMPQSTPYSVETLLNDQALEDYVTKDKYDDKNSDKSQTITECSNSSIIRKLNQSVCTSVEEKLPSKKRLTVHSSGIRSRMLNYSRSVEHRKKRPRRSIGSSRESSNERENNDLQKSLTKVYTNLRNTDEKVKKRSQSISGASTSSDVSLNSESERHSYKCKLNAKGVSNNESKEDNEAKDLSFDTVQTKSVDTVKVASEVISTALTKITEETISQDTLIGSDLSHYSKKEEHEPKLVSNVKSKSDKCFVEESNAILDAHIVKNFEQNVNLVNPEKSNISSSKSTRIPKPLELNSLPISTHKCDESVDTKDFDPNRKTHNTCQCNRNVIVANVKNLPISKTENKENCTVQKFKEEELRILTEKVKSSIMNEMQAINTVTIQTLMQMISKKKEETDKNSLEKIIAKNIESALKRRSSGVHVDYKKHEKNGTDLQCLQNDNLGGDFKSKSTKKLQLCDSDFNECESTKSSKSRKSDRTANSTNTIKSFENEVCAVKKEENLSNTQKVQFVSDCVLDYQIPEKTESSNSPSLPGETNVSTVAKPKGKRISKLVRNIPRSILNKELLGKNKPASAPTGFDKNQTDKFRRNVSNFFDKSVTSDTKTSLTSTRISSAKESFRTSDLPKDAKGLSKFEKRKQYGQFLRQKLTKIKSDNETVVVGNHKPIYTDKSNLAEGDNTINESINEIPFSQEPSHINDKMISNCATNSNLLDMYKFMESTNNINVPCDLHQDEGSVSEKTSNNNMIEAPGTKPKENVNFDTAISALIKPVKSQTLLQKQSPNPIDEVKSKESENIYQTFTVMADHHHIVDVFRNKFKKSSSFLSGLNKGSLCSTLSTLSVNTNDRNSYSTKPSTLLSLKKSENMLYRLDKVKSLFSCKERLDEFDETNEKKTISGSGLTLSYEFWNSTPQILSSPSDSSTDNSLTELNKLSRVKINLLEACQHLCKNDSQPKYTLYSPYTSYDKNTKIPEKDYLTFNDVADKNLHRCKHKFNIHNMLKMNHRFEETCKRCCQTCSRFIPEQSKSRLFAFTSNTTTNSNRNNSGENDLPIRLSRFVQKNERDRQGNYVVFKIDKKLQLKQQTSPKDTSRECFKIFMNNNVHKMQLDSDYPLRFSKYGYKSKFFDQNNFFTNHRTLSRSGKSWHGNTNYKKTEDFMHTLNKEIDNHCSKKNFSTVLAFPFNLKMANNLTNLNATNILSAEKDIVVDTDSNSTKTKVLPKSKLKQLCDSVTNLYQSLCNAKSIENLNSECDTGYLTDCDHYQRHTTNISKYIFEDKNCPISCKREKGYSLETCSQAHSSKYRNSERDHSISTNKTVETPESINMFNIKSIDDLDMRFKSIQTDRQENSECKIVSKSYDHKLIQTNLKRKHKRNVIPLELTTRSTSYDSIKNEEMSKTAVIPKTDLIDMLQSNPEFYLLITIIIKEILTTVGVSLTETSQEILKSIVEESFYSIARQSPKLNEEQQLLYSTFEKLEISQQISNVCENLMNKIRKKEINKNLQHPLLFEKFVVNRTNDLLKKVADIQESFNTVDKNESRNMFKKTEKTASQIKFNTIEDGKKSLFLSDTFSHDSLSSHKGKLFLQKKQSLINDLKAFGNVLTELKRSIPETQSCEHVIECCGLKTSNSKVVHKTSYKTNSIASTDTTEPDKLLQIMSKLPLGAILTLYRKVTNSNDLEISFESLIREIHKPNLFKNNIAKSTKSQDCILKALQSSTSEENICANKEDSTDSSLFTVTKVKTEINNSTKENDFDNVPVKSKEKTEMQIHFAKKNLKVSDSADNTKPVESGKESSHNTVPSNEKDENDIKNKELSNSSQVREWDLTKRLNKSLEYENKRKAFDKIKQSLTHKELFDKLLESYENEENIVYRLSNDEEFLKSQLQMVKSKESIEELLKQSNLFLVKSITQFVEELEDITKESSYKKSDKSSSKFFTLKLKMSRLFKMNSSKIKKFASLKKCPFQHSNINEEKIKKGGKFNFLKRKKIIKYTKDENSLNDLNFVKPQEIGNYFKRGFRDDNILLNRGFSDTSIESVIKFSERDTPLEYLLTLGYSIEEASNAIKDKDVENRLFAAITEARIWVNQVNTVQGTLLSLIAYKSKPTIMRYYLQLVEAIVNNRINNAVKLDSFLKVLEKVEDGDISMLYILESDKFEEEKNEEKLLKKHLRKVFIDVYRVAENEVTSKNEVLTKNQIHLLEMLAAKYRAGLQSHLEIIALYIGKGLLRSQVQLEAAMIYFSRLNSSEINLARFEKYCGIKS